MIVPDSSNADGIFRNPKSWPPGFRFHPTEEELILYYLKRKICRRRIQLNVIAEVDVYKWDPEELPGQSVLRTEERQWFFFSPRDRKYPNGARSNRATRHGYWKATGKDRDITSNSRCVGNKKTLVFYKGRAPSGERTNWVMHEFTMDEEELKRCTNAKDYYALYKLYKKSGAGPKNGEQYGAPFREEDWTEDGEYIEPEKPIQEITVPDPNGSGSSFGDALVNPEEEPPSDDLDELLGQFVVESGMNDQIHNLFATPPPKVAVEIEPENLIMEPPFNGAASSEPSTILDTWGRQWEEETSWNAAQSSISHLLSTEPPEVTSGLYDNYEQAIHGTDEVGFLEVDDLCEEKRDNFVPSTSLCAMTNTSDVSHFGQIDALNEQDIFHDAAMFLRDIGPMDQFGFLGDDNLGQLDYQPSSQVNNGDEHSGQLLWVHDQRCSVFESVQSEAQSASIGVINPSTTLHSMEMQNEGSNVAGGNSDSWINSYVSTVLGSIPTRPALASENALINRAFERMSSFGRMRVAPTTDNSNPEVVAVGGVQRRVQGGLKSQPPRTV